MRNIIFGLGVGIVLMSLLYITVTRLVKTDLPQSETTLAETLSDDEIIALAGSLGMVDAKSIVTTEYQEYTTISDYDIILKAKEFGMVFPEDVSKAETTTEAQTEDSEQGDEQTEVQTEEQTEEKPGESQADATTTDALEQTHSVRVFFGMSARDIAVLLYNENIVSNAFEFEKFVISKNMTKKLKTGVYDFKENEDYEKILNSMTGK